MRYAAQAICLPEQPQAIAVRLPVVHDHRQPSLDGEPHLLLESVKLNLLRHSVAIVVQADVPADKEAEVQEATDDCPAEAIIVE